MAKILSVYITDCRPEITKTAMEETEG